MFSKNRIFQLVDCKKIFPIISHKRQKSLMIISGNTTLKHSLLSENLNFKDFFFLQNDLSDFSIPAKILLWSKHKLAYKASNC